MRWTAFLMTLIVAVAAAADYAPAQQQAKPNVIFILCDDLGYADIGPYGQKKIKTPNLDRFAAEAMRFTQHYAGSTVCAPSRSCLLTGQHTGHAVVRGNPGSAVKDYKGDTALPADSRTFAKMFKQAGYNTAIIGKWGMGAKQTTGWPSKQGFDFFFGYSGHRDAHEYYPPHLWRNDEKVALNGKEYSHDLIGAEALKWLRETAPKAAADKPFMLYLTFTIPHSKLQVPDLGAYAKEKWPENEKAFAAMITRMDASVGKVLDTLKDLKVDDNTLVLFSSDNGPHGEGAKHDPDFFDGNGPLRGIKRDLYEGGIRVPFLARWPGKIKGGSTTDHVAAFWDFVPTAAELLQTAAPPDTDGISYLPTLLGQSDKQKKHDHLYWEFQERGGKVAVRFGNWKAVRVDVSKNADAPIELYDLSKDLGEKHDVAAEHPEIVKHAAELLRKNHQPSAIFPLFPDELKAADTKPRPGD
jgi:arylsulfatase A-like enzyme